MLPHTPRRLGKEPSERVLILDGAMGTMVQARALKEADFRGEICDSSMPAQTGNNDILCLTRPDVVSDIHRAYVDAGADILSTNTFNANAISQADYGTVHLVSDINRAGAALARSVADDYMEQNPGRIIRVAGSMGPTNRAASMSPDVADPGLRNVTYDQLHNAYFEQATALLEGGADLLLFETVFDPLNLKAGLDGAMEAMRQLGVETDIIVSATVSDRSGRLLTGQTLEAFAASVAHCDAVISLGLNCSFGTVDMLPHLRALAEVAPAYVSCHPNAGLPDRLGNYAETPETFAAHVAPMLTEGLVNIAGGCCGTTPAHIAALRSVADSAVPHRKNGRSTNLRLAGLEPLEVCRANNFVNIGERCNVAGSRKFLRLIKEKKYDEALEVARRQVLDGAMILDVNMDDAMLDAAKEMTVFLNYLASDPDTARVPVMVDASDWKVAEAGLKCLQGKGIINSISLKEGEEAFLHHARRARELGAAVVVMAFDEEGQADTYERKIAVCERAYKLLIREAGFEPHDIIFDPNIMAVATGIEAHDRYGIDYIKAVKWIKDNLPCALTSGGVSNLSFAFRGHNTLREAMHAVFLYHAIAAGLDMAILNPATSVTYESIEPGLRTLIEDVVLARRPGAADELAAYAAAHAAEKGGAPVTSVSAGETDSRTVSERLRDAVISGDSTNIASDLTEALESGMTAVGIIEGPLMEGIDRVGTLFGEGKMFLPQVVKTARTMKRAVDILEPHIHSEAATQSTGMAGTVVFATVKGDVHDIGKNIVAIVMACNNYRIIDLGVMVPAEQIVSAAIAEKADMVCVSGLITPSLAEMVKVAEAMEAAGLRIPLVVGGATTSRLHTALKIAPAYSGPVVHASDAARNPVIAARLMGDEATEYIEALNREYDELRQRYEAQETRLLTLDEAIARAPKLDWNQPSPVPVQREYFNAHIPIAEVAPFINYKMLLHAWRLTGPWLEDFPWDGCSGCTAAWTAKHGSDPKAMEALHLYTDARTMLQQLIAENADLIRGAVRIMEASADSDAVTLHTPEGDISLPMLRRQTDDGSRTWSLADMVRPADGKNTHHISENIDDTDGKVAWAQKSNNDIDDRIACTKESTDDINGKVAYAKESTDDTDNRIAHAKESTDNIDSRVVYPKESINDTDNKESTDYVGVFMVTAGHGEANRLTALRATGDDYKALLLQTLCDRLAEAASEWLHTLVRRKIWAYAPNENLSVQEILANRYFGIRPAIGYDSLPDQSLMHDIAALLPLFALGVEVTPNGALTPSSTVCGLYLWHPDSRYFNVGNLDDAQLTRYAARRGITSDTLRHHLGTRN
ncbi:MAG: methionine synthase [Bacteroides sp.]|nr:methionine synthase [Bacteroides sp.]